MMHTADGKRAHCWLFMPIASSTNCGGPPSNGARINREGISPDAPLGGVIR